MDRITITGVVVPGSRVGRTLGFPTANIPLPEDGNHNVAGTLVDGVYAAIVDVGGTAYHAIANVGVRPTVGEDAARNLEAYLFGFSGDLYGREITVTLLEHIRTERKFPSLDALRSQIEADRAVVLDYFRNTK